MFKKQLIKNLMVMMVSFGFFSTAALAETIKVKVNGMVCPFCAQGITKKLKAEESIESQSIDVKLEDHLVTLKTKSDLSDEKLSKLIKDSGYEVQSIERIKE